MLSGGFGARPARSRDERADMYLFTRRTRLAGGNGLAGMAWAASIATKVKEVTGHEVQLWGNVFSPGVGTISWSGWFADLTSLEEVGDKLQADPSMEDLSNAGAEYTDGSLDDSLLQPIYGDPTAGASAKYVGGAVAVAAGGNIERAMTLGVEIAQKSEAITGLPTMFVRSITGPYGAVGWLTGYADVTAMEKAEDALASDATWLKLIDSTKGCFVEDPANTQATIYRRLA
jgi:hypothetical protein